MFMLKITIPEWHHYTTLPLATQMGIASRCATIIQSEGNFFQVIQSSRDTIDTCLGFTQSLPEFNMFSKSGSNAEHNSNFENISEMTLPAILKHITKQPHN